MRVFAELAPSQQDETLKDAASAVVAQLRPLKAPRSLCEIAIDAEDYGWLTAWASSLRPLQTARWLDGVNARSVALQADGINLTYSESFGCLFLLLASETARRESTEGRVWADIRKPYPRLVENALFVQGQPRDILKDSMESAARKLRLRNVYGQAGTQEYYLTVYLQFGFTRRGFASRLPEWLAGQGTTESVQRLLGIGGDPLASGSFVELWDALRNYRKNNITETVARARIAASTWTLPEWTDDLLKQARAKKNLGTAEIEQIADLEEPPPPGFLGPPKLRWSLPDAPEFACEIENLADFDLTSDRYLVQSSGATLAGIYRAEDGSYRPEPAAITFPPDSPVRMAYLVDDLGDSPASQAVALWDQSEEVEAFDLRDGSRTKDAWEYRFADGRDYGLLISADLEVQPGGMAFRAIGGLKKLYLYRADSGGAKAFLEGEEIWSSARRKPKPTTPEPDWAKSVSATVEPTNRINLSESSARSLRVYGMEENVEPTYVRVGNAPLDFRQDEYGDWLTDDFDVLPFCLSGEPPFDLEVKIGLRNGARRANVSRKLSVSPIGILQLSGDGWRVVHPGEPLSASEAKTRSYKILMPSSFNRKRNFALMEGPAFLRRLWTHPRPLDSLGGYGEILGVRAPYNWTKDENLLDLSREIYDQGVLDAFISDGSGKSRLYLTHPIEPGPKHSVVLWTPNQPPIIAETAESVDLSDGFTTWDVSLPSHIYGEDVFIAIAYDGARIGAKWPAYPHGLSYIDKSSAPQTAAMLRWMRAPIVSDNWIHSIRQFAYAHPGFVLKAWLEEFGLPSDLSQGASGEQWLSAVRKIFSEWTPDPDSAASAMRVGLIKLMRLDPVLMGRVARAAMRKYRDIRKGVVQTRALIAGANGYEIDRRETELLNETCDQMGVAPQFLNNIVRKLTDGFDYSNLSATDRNNAETALTVAPFRDYLALRALSALAR